ncbi:MAG: diaminopimelate epimerase [Clostridium sp.]|nr:diaminopimelate epimerase [Clostridium sp.]
MQLLFTKMHGIGNDYIYIDCTKSPMPVNLPQLSRELSDRHTGIGSDGIILILPSERADFAMRIFNADGSEARMCGNGSRCVGKYVADRGLTDKPDITLETLSGIKHLSLHRDKSGTVASVTVDMGTPTFESSEIGMTIADGSFIHRPLPAAGDELPSGTTLTAVGMGNPHGVLLLPRGSVVTDRMIGEVGPRLENDEIWSDRANIEFVVPSADGLRLAMRVWERGSGETMACGTGACASAVAAIEAGLTCGHRRVTVALRGGDLEIEWNPETGHVLMTGPATTVFDGTITIDDQYKPL